MALSRGTSDIDDPDIDDPEIACADGRPRAGRRRDPSRDEAILAATLATFAEEGYAGVSIEGVAARAGVGKATIYRRCASKAQLVVEAVRVGACLNDHLPDTGDLRSDLASMLRAMVQRLRSDDDFRGQRLKRHADIPLARFAGSHCDFLNDLREGISRNRDAISARCERE